MRGKSVTASLVLSEVYAACEFAYDKQVNAVVAIIAAHDFRTEGTCALQGFPHLCRSQIAEKAKFGTYAEQSPFRAVFPRQRIPLRSADRAEQYGIGRFARGKRLCWQTFSGGIVGTSAYEPLVNFEFMSKPVPNRVQYLDCLAHDFRPHAVSGDNCNAFFHFCTAFLM